MKEVIDIPQVTETFIRAWYNRAKPSMSFRATTMEEFLHWKGEARNKIKELLGDFPNPIPLNPQILSEGETEHYVRQKWIIQSEEDCWVPLYLLIPKGIKGRLPAILCAHGHGPYGKDPVAGVHFNEPDRKSQIARHNYNYGEQMAMAGFITIAPDWRSFGERVAYHNPYAYHYPLREGEGTCNYHFLQHLILGRTLLGANIFDGMRVIDFLTTRKEVNPERIGCMGLSYGGTMATYLSLLDDRIKAGDIICYANTFEHYSIITQNLCGSDLIPSLYKYMDIPDIIAAIAPKPLLIESGASDTCFWIFSALKAHATAKRAYEVSGKPENIWLEVFQGEHSFSGKMAFDFFKKFLV